MPGSGGGVLYLEWAPGQCLNAASEYFVPFSNGEMDAIIKARGKEVNEGGGKGYAGGINMRLGDRESRRLSSRWRGQGRYNHGAGG